MTNQPSRQGCQPRPGPLARVFAAGIDEAVRIAEAYPALRVDAFEPTWTRVDGARDRVARLGLGSRIHVWHRAALATAALARGTRTRVPR